MTKTQRRNEMISQTLSETDRCIDHVTQQVDYRRQGGNKFEKELDDTLFDIGDVAEAIGHFKLQIKAIKNVLTRECTGENGEKESIQEDSFENDLQNLERKIQALNNKLVRG